MMDVSAIVVSFNSEGRIGHAVEAHEQALSHLKAEVIVVDNASADSSVTEARAALRRGHVIANPENVGYGKAANQGIVAAQGRTCLILNDDARLKPGAIDQMLAVLDESDDIALVGPRIVDQADDPMPSARWTFPGPAEEGERLANIVKEVDRNSWYPVKQTHPTEVSWLVGACILGKTEILRATGGFNPAFFLYSEDIDLCRRLHELGYRIITVPGATCVHTGSVSTGVAYGNEVSIRRRAESRDIYYRIWHTRPVRSLIHLRRSIGLTNQPGRLKHHLPQVLWDGPSLHDLRVLAPLAISPIGKTNGG